MNQWKQELKKWEDTRGGAGGDHLGGVSDDYQQLGPEGAHKWLLAGLADDVLGGLVAL